MRRTDEFIPARLMAEQTARVLNCQPHNIPGQSSADRFKPLDTLQPKSVKYFALVEVLELANDRPVAGENDKRCEPAVAEEKFIEETRSVSFV
jgi:hypothetical protein